MAEQKKGGRDGPRIGLPFERPIIELEAKIGELLSLSESTGMNLNGELRPRLALLPIRGDADSLPGSGAT